MSGTNSLINSIITKKGGNLTSALEDANNFVIKEDGKKEDKKKDNKKK